MTTPRFKTRETTLLPEFKLLQVTPISQSIRQALGPRIAAMLRSSDLAPRGGSAPPAEFAKRTGLSVYSESYDMCYRRVTPSTTRSAFPARCVQRSRAAPPNRIAQNSSFSDTETVLTPGELAVVAIRAAQLPYPDNGRSDFRSGRSRASRYSHHTGNSRIPLGPRNNMTRATQTMRDGLQLQPRQKNGRRSSTQSSSRIKFQSMGALGPRDPHCPAAEGGVLPPDANVSGHGWCPVTHSVFIEKNPGQPPAGPLTIRFDDDNGSVRRWACKESTPSDAKSDACSCVIVLQLYVTPRRRRCACAGSSTLLPKRDTLQIFRNRDTFRDEAYRDGEELASVLAVSYSARA
ncbi:hypothetical protein BV898_19031 [Hypsibius exemplaris]|uniref:Uncharacterized protein n=1 Tax=Hypsibius exemplaris TaxID=2072580 RepID=A0A9X6NIT6_HYPEX|nr:hypothetical protein BV898_19031 [Hypsibius exemplaris]